MRLHCNSLILDFQLGFSYVLHGQGTTSVGNPSIPLILFTGSTYFVEKWNIIHESCIPIAWLNKGDNSISKDQKCTCRPEPLKAEVCTKSFILCLVFREATPVEPVPEHHSIAAKMAEATDVITVPDDDKGAHHPRPKNPISAEEYVKGLDNIMLQFKE